MHNIASVMSITGFLIMCLAFYLASKTANRWRQTAKEKQQQIYRYQDMSTVYRTHYQKMTIFAKDLLLRPEMASTGNDRKQDEYNRITESLNDSLADLDDNYSTDGTVKFRRNMKSMATAKPVIDDVQIERTDGADEVL